MATKSGTATVKNDWGITLSQLTLRHRRSNDSDKEEIQTYYSVGVGDKTAPMAFTYETGAGSDFDYWWVTFMTTGGQQWGCKDNFYCSVSSGDNGAVELKLHGDSQSMSVKFSSSSGCDVSLYLYK